MMVTFDLHEGATLSAQEKQELERAKKLPIVYDDDSPELTDVMEQAFIRARRCKPYPAQSMPLRAVSRSQN